ncbi:MAG: hypothetical protein PHO27_02305 [Sulfuricurvum sp.]|nr:hypothetical protein [Sulfuricurvum sp.]
MTNNPNLEIFYRAFSSRIEIVEALAEALKSSPDNFRGLKKASIELEETISEIGEGTVEDQYRAYQKAIAIFVFLAEWKHAIRNAEPDAQRFLSSAKLQVSEIDKSLSFTTDERLNVFLDQIQGLQNVDELSAILDHLKEWTLPLLLFANQLSQEVRRYRNPSSNGNSAHYEKLETTVAFLKFDIDGAPAKNCNYLKPGVSYDLTIEVRVSNWPEDTSILSLTPVTIDSRERDWLPSFKFTKPQGEGPFTLTGTGRAVLMVAHSFGSRPYEFLYAAEFDDMSNSHDVAIVGHRRLLLEGSDVSSNPLSGFSHVDRHLLDIRNNLRNFHGLHSDDVSNTMIILGGLGNIAAQALRDGLFEAGTLEKPFQQQTSTMLRNYPNIGGHLQSHAEAAGGITDLTFRDIPIELKVENSKVLYPEDCSKYFNQTAAYAIALGKRIGVLAVLEASPKSAPVGVIEKDIEVFAHPTGNAIIAIVVVVVRGGFPKPSSYSK